MHSKSLSIVATLLVMLVATATTLTTMESVFAGKGGREYNQATSQVSDCGNGSVPTNVLCHNTGSQIQGDNNAATITGEQRSQPPTTGTLVVKKVIQCAEGFQCPSLPDPDSGFVIGFESSTGVSFSVIASGEGTPIRLEPQVLLSTSETSPPLPGFLLVEVTADDGCFGSIEAGQTKICTWTNSVIPSPRPPL
jgi:hypothetical protein